MSSGAGVWHSMMHSLPLQVLLSMSGLCVIVVVWTLRTRKRFTLGSVMFAVVGIALLIAELLHRTQTHGHGAPSLQGSLLILLWCGWLSFLPAILAPKQRMPLTNAQWSKIDARILACDPRRALRLIRNFTKTGANEARDIHWERFQTLRFQRSKDFVCTDEEYWRCLYD